MDPTSTCPFCGAETGLLTVEKLIYKGEYLATYAVCCVICGARGPTAKTKALAIKKWAARRAPTPGEPR